MPRYLYECRHCGYRFERRTAVWLRDEPEVCDQCGCGAARVFRPAMVNIPPGFSGIPTSQIEMSLEECRAKEKEYSNLPSRPSKPTFEAVLKKELDARGIRHPERLTDSRLGFDKSCLKSEDAL